MEFNICLLRRQLIRGSEGIQSVLLTLVSWKRDCNRCGWCQRLMPTLEVLAELMEESGQGVSVATVDCTVEKKLCTDRFSIRVRAWRASE